MRFSTSFTQRPLKNEHGPRRNHVSPVAGKLRARHLRTFANHEPFSNHKALPCRLSHTGLQSKRFHTKASTRKRADAVNPAPARFVFRSRNPQRTLPARMRRV